MTPQEAVANWVYIPLDMFHDIHRLTPRSQGGINDLKKSIGAKVCTPCTSNGANNGTSGTGTVTLQYKSGIDQGTAWMSEFLAAASGQYTFDCVCGHWYGGANNALADDQSMIESQISEMASLAQQYGIEDIVLAEMQRVNGDQEVRSFRTIITSSNPSILFAIMSADVNNGSSANSYPGSRTPS